MSPDDALLGADLASSAAAHHVVGAAVGVSIGGQRSVAVWGTAHLDAGTPVTRDTAFLVGSVTKAMTAALVVREAEVGSLELDDPVRRHLPEFVLDDDELADEITVRHLLTHTAGFDGELWIDTGEDPGAASRLLARLAGARRLSSAGHRFSYSNGGYVVLGRLLEAVTGRSFEAVLRDGIGVPAGSAVTTDLATLGDVPHAVGHVRTGDDASPVVTVDPVQGPAGLAAAGSRTWARLDDLLAVGELLLGRHGDDAMRRAVIRMRDPQVVVADPNNGGTMALGVFLDDRWGTPVVLHDGGVAGQAAYLRMLPELDTVIAVACTGGVPQVFHRHVFAGVAARLGLHAPLGAVEDPAVVVDPRRFIGRYAAGETEVVVSERPRGIEAVITWGRGSAGAVRTPSLPLRPVDQQAFLAALGGRDYVLVFPPPEDRCDHVLAGLRLLPRASEDAD